MHCPKCAGEQRIVDSRHRDGTTVWRRRECRVCAFRVTTFEVSADRLGDLELAEGKLARLSRFFMELGVDRG